MLSRVLKQRRLTEGGAHGHCRDPSRRRHIPGTTGKRPDPSDAESARAPGRRLASGKATMPFGVPGSAAKLRIAGQPQLARSELAEPDRLP